MTSVYAGALSILPPVLAIVLALLTKEVVSSLLIGILSGAIIYAVMAELNPVVAPIQIMFDMTIQTVDLYIILFCCLLGALVHVVSMAGGSIAYGNWASRKLKSKRSAMLATGLLGCLIFIDDYFNCLTVGTVMQPVTDHHRVSRAKLAYTQLPYALLVGACCIVGYLIAGFTNGNLPLMLLTSLSCLLTTLFILHRQSVCSSL